MFAVGAGIGLEKHSQSCRISHLLILSFSETLILDGVYPMIWVRDSLYDLADEIEIRRLGEYISDVFGSLCTHYGRCQAENNDSDDPFYFLFYIFNCYFIVFA